LLVNVDSLVTRPSTLQGALEKMRKEQGFTGPAFAVVPPEQVPFLFAHETELSLAKSLASLVAGQVHPYLKTSVDVVWLVYGASKLWYDWNQPDRNSTACLFTLGGLAVDAASLPGGVYPSLKMPDHWANGLDFIVKTGESLSQGKLPPTNELLWSADERLRIPVQILKCAGIALDPSPALSGFTATPLRPALAPNLAQAQAKPATTPA
jgi:hypothetical protein